MMYWMTDKNVMNKLDMGTHVFAPNVGMNDILPGADPKDYDNLYVHLPEGDTISEAYPYQNKPLGHINTHDFTAAHGLAAHLIQNYDVENRNDTWENENLAWSEQYAS